MRDYTNKNNSNVGAQAKTSEYDEGLRAYMLKVYNHMSVGIAITGVMAYLVANTPALLQMLFSGPQAYIVMFAPLVFVWVFSAKVHKMSESAARTCFYAFAALMGLSLSTILLAYTGESVAKTFFITASMFGAMSIYGYTTKKDLTGMGSFLFMGVIGLVIAMVVNIFLASSALQFAISAAGVLIFTGLTAYDSQKIKNNYFMVGANQLGKAAIMGALTLYLDFINLFIFLLRLIGDRR